MRSAGGGDYNPRDYPPVAVTVDVALFAIRRDVLYILLIQRGVEPFAGAWALPGGFVQPGEDLDAAAARELAEETRVTEGAIYLEQLRSYGSPERDPRMRVVTVAYWGACASLPAPLGRSDAAHAEFVRVSQLEDGEIELAFDHEAIVRDALERVRAKLEYTALAARFCPSEFTISELRNVYETVWNTKLDPGNFQRKVRENRSFQQVGQSTLASGSVHAPAGAAQLMAFERVEASRNPLDEARASEASESWLPTAGRLEQPGVSRPRSGRPASLWIARDSDLTLNSPIPRRRANSKV